MCLETVVKSAKKSSLANFSSEPKAEDLILLNKYVKRIYYYSEFGFFLLIQQDFLPELMPNYYYYFFKNIFNNYFYNYYNYMSYKDKPPANFAPY